MKLVYSVILLTIFITGCKKDNDNGNCPLKEETSYDNAGNMIAKFIYEYDNQGRISKISSGVAGNYSAILNYYTDSVIVTSTNNSTRAKYYLNSNGKADSAMVDILGTPQQLKLYYKYTYDGEGFMTAEREIFSQLYNGSTLLDTAYKNYTIQNGNIIRLSDTHNAEDIIYEYNSASRPANNLVIGVPEQAKFIFLGKPSKNLISAAKSPTGAVNFAYTYSYDKKGNLIEMITTFGQQSNLMTKVTYSYHCN